MAELHATFEDDDGPTLSPGGWEAAHVGVEHDGFVLDGLPVWSLVWREEPGVRLRLPHPAHPGQQHAFSVYDIDDGARAARFAAAELSNGVWGFYRWVASADAGVGESANGTLRYTHDLGAYEHGRYDRAEPIARIYDVRTGKLVFDGAAWRSGRVVPQKDGAWLLSLVQGELQTLFRIEPAAGTFRDLGGSARPRPLAELQRAAAAARRACDDQADAALGRRIAPDGSIMVELHAVEWSNTHWVRSPRVTEIATGRVLLDLWGTDWDAWPAFPRRRTVRLSLRRYRLGGDAEAEIQLAPDRYVVFEPAGESVGPLSDLPEALEAASRRAAAAAPRRPRVTPLRPTLRSYFVALLIFLGTLALIAAATLLSLRLQPQPPQKLDTIPPMPPPPPATSLQGAPASPD
jgi:hypothetical protein